jgi:ribosomal protein L32
VNTKRCSKCGKVKTLGEFNRHKAKPDGLQPYCKACHRMTSSLREKENPSRTKENWRRYYQDHKIEENAKSMEQQSKYRAFWHQLAEKQGFATCVVCGAPAVAHHVCPDTKLFRIGDWINKHAPTKKNIAIFLDELKKCVPLCRKHHPGIHNSKERWSNRGAIGIQYGLNGQVLFSHNWDKALATIGMAAPK